MARSNNFQVRVTGDTTKFDAAMNKAQMELRGFSDAAKSAFALVGITSATAAFASFARTIGDFERANSELAAVLGTNLKGVESLTKSAKELGRTSEFTASDVTKLQIALSRLGFSTNQIEAMQKSVLNFALAMGTDLASAADFAGASLRAFGLQAEDTEKLLDVMSAATTNSALDFSKLQASIAIVAPIAKSFGLDVKETAAFLGVLSNNGFDASSAATALRNILLNLADDNGKLAQGIGHSAKSFDEIIAAFKELQARGVDVAEVLAMTDKRSAAAASTIINQAESVQSLKGELDKAHGSLQQMADTMSDNLVGSTKSLSSAWEGLILSLEESKGPMKAVVDALTDIVNRLTDIITKQDKLTYWEAILGPIAGGYIASRWKKRQATDPGYSGGGEGGGSRGEPPTPAENGTSTNASRQSLTPEQKRALAQKKEIADSRSNLSEWVNQAKPAIVSSLDQAKVEVPVGLAVKPESIEYYKDVISASLGDTTVYIGFEADTEHLRDITREVESIVSSLAESTGETIGQLIGDLATGGDAWSNFKNSALSAFGDMAVSVGKMAVATGVATLGIKAALESLNGYVAIAAGVALVALGTAVKTGLSNVASGNYSAGYSSVASGSYSSGNSDYETREVNVKVTGTLTGEGSALIGVINNVNNQDYYTT